MNSLQSALRQTFARDIELIEKEERRQKFERAAADGKKLMERASQAVLAGKPGEALSEVRRNRYACAASLAKAQRWSVPRAFKELEQMEKLLAQKAAELKEQATAAA